MKILNLYSGIGGNRKLWEDVEVTAIEYNAEIAAIYQEYFPQDTVVVTDAHEYLLAHYKEFDFIWASPPCQTHSRLRHAQKNIAPAAYPDARLWQEIIFLKHHAICPFVIENVIPYYDVFIPPSLELDRHLFWTNINIAPLRIERKYGNVAKQSGMGERFGFIIRDKKITVGDNHDMKGQILRNLVNPEIGLAILDQIRGIKRKSKLKQISILEEV